MAFGYRGNGRNQKEKEESRNFYFFWFNLKLLHILKGLTLFKLAFIFLVNKIRMN